MQIVTAKRLRGTAEKYRCLIPASGEYDCSTLFWIEDHADTLDLLADMLHFLNDLYAEAGSSYDDQKTIEMIERIGGIARAYC